MFITWTYLRNMKVSFLFMIIFFATSLNALGADNNIHLISTELTRGQLEQKDGKYIGSYAAFFSKASKRSGVQIDYRIVPWTRAVKETERSDNLLLFPFSRTQERENRFT